MKEVKNFKTNGVWFLPPTQVEKTLKTIELAIEQSQYSENPDEYFASMEDKRIALEALAKAHPNCTCAIRHNGNIFYKK